MADVFFTLAAIIGYLGAGIFVGKLVWIYYYKGTWTKVDTGADIVFIVLGWPLVVVITCIAFFLKGIIKIVTDSAPRVDPTEKIRRDIEKWEQGVAPGAVIPPRATKIPDPPPPTHVIDKR